MVVYYFDGRNIAVIPLKANSPAPVNADAVKSFAITDQLFQLITGWNSQEIERLCGMELLQLPIGPLAYIGRQGAYSR